MPLDPDIDDVMAMLSWTTAVTADAMRLAAERGRPMPSLPDGFQGFTLGPAFFEVPPGRSLLAQLNVLQPAEGEADANELQWHLHYFERPEGDPPLEIQRYGEQLGHVPGLWDIVRRGSGQTTPIAGVFHLNFDLPADRWTCRVLPSRPRDGDPVAALSANAQIESVGYKLPAGPNGLQEVSIELNDSNKDAPYFSTTAHARGVVDENALTFVETIIGMLVATAFEKVERE